MRRNHSSQSLTRKPQRFASLFTCSLLVYLTATNLVFAQLPNPAAYLTFDEGAGTVAADSSGNNHNATLFGAAG